MNRKNPFLRFLLSPFAWIYNVVTWFRNQLFDSNLLPAKKYPIPIICVGNIATGGTGKTPFTEYLIALLKKQYRVAALSRGYKRKTTGLLLVNENNTALEVGDEACQVKQKFPDITVVVDGNRRRGIRYLLSLPEKERPHVILLDDAMQHRYVIPSLTIMLTDYQNMYFEDYLLPVGNLRESVKAVYRADIVVVTKCIGVIKPITLRIIENNMMLMASQHLFFSKTKYFPLKPLFPSLALHPFTLDEIKESDEILLVTGIAEPQPLIEKIKTYCSGLRICVYPDHHPFSLNDVNSIDVEFQNMNSKNKRIIVTEKDAMRLKSIEFLPEKWKPFLYYLPISIDFLFEQGENFDARILTHVISTINIYKKNVKN